MSGVKVTLVYFMLIWILICELKTQTFHTKEKKKTTQERTGEKTETKNQNI